MGDENWIASRAVQRQITDEYHRLRQLNANVIGVSLTLLGCKPGATVVINIHVRRKILIRHGPPSAVLPESLVIRVGHERLTLPTQVVEVGSFTYSNGCQPALYDPCMGGDAFEVPLFKGPCTIAAFVKDPNNDLYLLTASHALTYFMNIGSDELDVLQYPGGPVIATVWDYTKFQLQVDMTSDSGIAQVVNPPPVGIASQIRQLGTLGNPILNPPIPKEVRKYGAATCYSSGKVCEIGTFFVDPFTHVDTLAVQPVITAPGDSGALLVDTENCPIGILFATDQSSTRSLASRISRVIDDLGLQGWTWT